MELTAAIRLSDFEMTFLSLNKFEMTFESSVFKSFKIIFNYMTKYHENFEIFLS